MFSDLSDRPSANAGGEAKLHYCNGSEKCSPTPQVEPLEGRVLFASVGSTNLPWTAAPTAAQTGATLAQPTVRTVNPTANAKGVFCTTAISADLNIPNGGVNGATLTSANVYLYRTADGVRIPATVNTSGGGDVIVLKPTATLNAFTKYTFVISSGVRDVAGAAFVPFGISFTTGAAPTALNSPVNFKQLPQAAGLGRQYFCLAPGPDGKLYAGADNGNIYRFDIKPDGSLGTPTTIGTIRRNNGFVDRFVVGLAFDPKSTPTNPILWVSHTGVSDLEIGGTAGAHWTGKVSVLTGSGLANYHDAVIRLPRSVRDHFTNQLVFGPDGALYFGQASQSAMGQSDLVWGSRPETMLSASILRLDVKALGITTLDARTLDFGGSYNPFVPGAPLTVYATGVRNSLDLVWHRNGSLYAPANGSAAGGNTPAGPVGSGVPMLTNVSTAETDYLFRIVKGGYYGHPNPKHGAFVLNGGNPTSGPDAYEVKDYPVGVKPDARWKKAVYDFGPHQAPAGAMEYKGYMFGGALNGKLLVCRYSGGDDIIALTVNPDGSVAKAEAGLRGLTGLADPVDIVQRPNGAGMYVIELAKKRITFLKAV